MRTIALSIAVAMALVPASVRAEAPVRAAAPIVHHHTMRLIKLGNGRYTVPMNELIDPAWHGTVRCSRAACGRSLR